MKTKKNVLITITSYLLKRMQVMVNVIRTLSLISVLAWYLAAMCINGNDLEI